jgi:hypothetical protein
MSYLFFSADTPFGSQDDSDKEFYIYKEQTGVIAKNKYKGDSSVTPLNLFHSGSTLDFH